MCTSVQSQWKQAFNPCETGACVTWCCMRCSGRAVRWCGSSSWLLCLRRHSKLKDGLLLPERVRNGAVSDLMREMSTACHVAKCSRDYESGIVGKSWCVRKAWEWVLSVEGMIRETAVQWPLQTIFPSLNILQRSNLTDNYIRLVWFTFRSLFMLERRMTQFKVCAP